MNAPAVDRLGAERQRADTQSRHDAPHFVDREIDIVQRDQR
jgi:hypothetical protein